MKIIVCLEDKKGMMFNKRRLSKDRILIEEIGQTLEMQTIWMNAYSYKLFESLNWQNIKVDEDFLQNADAKDACFVENQKLVDYKEKIDELIIYWWNRRYPADFYFDLDLNDFDKMNETEFEGSSHEKITKQIYVRRTK